MDRLQYNILMEETGIYDKKEIKAEDIDSCDSELVFKTPNDNKIFEIVQNDLSTEEIRIALFAKQIIIFKSINKTIGFIALILFVSLMIGIFCLISPIL